jgi:hypothetical protein
MKTLTHTLSKNLKLSRFAILICTTLFVSINAVFGQVTPPTASSAPNGIPSPAAPSVSEGKAILDKMKTARLAHKTFSAEIEIISAQGKVQLEQESDKITPDGIPMQKIEMLSQTPGNSAAMALRSFIQILNTEGRWTLIHSKAINLKYMAAASKSVAEERASGDQGGAPSDDDDTYVVKEITYNNMPCYQVTEIVSDKNKAKALELLDNPELKRILGAGKIKASDVPITSLKIYYIDKSNFTLYGLEQFDQNGNKTLACYYRKVVFDMPLADDIFKIPDGYQKVTANTKEEYMKYLTGH